MYNDVLQFMPKMLSGKDLDSRLSVFPEYDNAIINQSAPERLIALQDIYQIFVSNVMSREIYTKLYLALLRSLQKKQSILAVRQSNKNSKMIRQKSYESIIGGSDSFSIIGPSGIGKSSSISRAVNILTEKSVLELANTKIIACIQIQTPADCSVKGLLFEILRKADEMLSTNYYKNAVKSHATVDMLVGTVSQVALNHIGLLIVDEIQNVVNSKNGKTIIGTLTQLINNSGVSICMVGTPESTIFFEQERMLARRSLGLKYTTMSYDNEFQSFCKAILKYCYVQESITVDESMLMWLYQHSGGNVSVVVSIIHDAQEISILENIERLDIATLNFAFEKRMTMLHGFLNMKVTKVNTIKKKKTDFHNTIVSPSLTEDIKIYQIVMNAKELQKDIVTELHQNGFKISEVAI